jgi:23S rRNA pseudouridine2457 synthase
MILNSYFIEDNALSRLILFNKPYGVLCQFRRTDDRPTLADFFDDPSIHPCGRLDHDSEGLLLLTDDGILNSRITEPRFKLPKTYWAQVDNDINSDAVSQLKRGVMLKDGLTSPALAKKLVEPELWPRNPPIRYRASIPTSWVELVISEGRNRQVRRMTAAVGFPTLRLVRVNIGEWSVHGLGVGEWREIEVSRHQLR